MAALEMLRGEGGIHTLSKQMGNSAAVIERHYSKLTAMMAADRLVDQASLKMTLSEPEIPRRLNDLD